MKKALVAGAGGFIGHHMVKYLKKKNWQVRGVDIKKNEYDKTATDQFFKLDLREKKNCIKAVNNVDYIFNFAANMGGIGFIDKTKASVQKDNVLINTHLLDAAKNKKIKRYFFASSACVYPTYKQTSPKNLGLKEKDAYPADCDNEYGWEKLFSERLCQNYFTDFGLETRIARFHNVYGPYGVWQGGREKSPAALCRKIAMVKDGGTIEIWGDGRQTRSYMYVDDCVEGVYRLTMSNIHEPINIGSNELVSINQLVDMIAKIANKKIKKKYDLSKPQGVRGRNSDNRLIKKLLNWQPSIPLEQGLKIIYDWIEKQVKKHF